jgi:hypothetical protein
MSGEAYLWECGFGVPAAKKAFAFLITPAVSWLLTGTVMGIAALLSSRRYRGFSSGS